MGKAAVAGKPGSDVGANAGMPVGEMKKHLRFAREEPVQIAFAIGGDGKAVLQMHRRKPGRSLEKQLREEAPDSKNHRWGTLAMDADDPKLAKVTVNKASSGMSRKLVLALKGTGCSKVKVMLEDGTEIEAHEDQDGDLEIDVESPHGQGHGGRPEIKIMPRHGQQEQALALHGKGSPDGSNPTVRPADPDGLDDAGDPEASDEGPVVPSMTPTGEEGQQSGRPDGKTLAYTLTGLVKRMMDAIKQDPSQKAALIELATDAQASLKRGDLEGTAAGLEVFRMALDDVAGGTAAQGAGRGNGTAAGPAAKGKGANGQARPANGTHDAPKQAGNHGASHPAAPVITKARGAWAATRQKIEGEIATLTKQFEAEFTDHEIADELAASFKARVDSVLRHLDEALSHKLDEVNKAADAAQRAKLVDDAHRLIAKYGQHISSDPTIEALDNNPFVPMAMAKTLTATLSVLSKSIH